VRDAIGWIILAAGVLIILTLLPYRAKYEGSFFYWGLRGFRRAVDEAPDTRTPGVPRPWPAWLQATAVTLAALGCVGVALILIRR